MLSLPPLSPRRAPHARKSVSGEVQGARGQRVESGHGAVKCSMSLHFPILIGLSKCIPGLSIPVGVPDKNDLSDAFGGMLRSPPERASPASCTLQSVMESAPCVWIFKEKQENRCLLLFPFFLSFFLCH